MLDVALNGTGGFMPLHNRFLTAMVARLNGKMLLIDCGEGTQINLRRIGWGFKDIDVICITHQLNNNRMWDVFYVCFVQEFLK